MAATAPRRPGPARPTRSTRRSQPQSAPALADLLDLKAIARRAAREAEKKALLQVLERVRWNRAEAARVLKVSYKTLLSKLTECGVPPRRSRSQ